MKHKITLGASCLFLLLSTLSFSINTIHDEVPTEYEVNDLTVLTKAVNAIIDSKIMYQEDIIGASEFLLNVEDLPKNIKSDLKKCIKHAQKTIVLLKKLKTTKYNKDDYAKQCRQVLSRAYDLELSSNFDPVTIISDGWNTIWSKPPPPKGDCITEQLDVTTDCLEGLRTLVECGAMSQGDAAAEENMCDMKGMMAKILCDSANDRGENFYGQILVAELRAEATCEGLQGQQPSPSQVQTPS